MRHHGTEVETDVLRAQLRELEGEVARYREVVERLTVELATYRKREEFRTALFTGSAMHAERSETDPRPESETILEQAEARLSAALERLRAGSDRRGSTTRGGGP